MNNVFFFFFFPLNCNNEVVVEQHFSSSGVAQGTPDAEQRTKSSNRKLKSGFSSLFSAQGPIGIENMFSISFSKAFLR